MADISWGTITLGSAAKTSVVTAGETLSEGDVCYLLASKYMKASCDTTDAKADAKLIAITAASADGSLFIGARTGSKIATTGTPFTQGAAYVVSAADGKVAPIADLATTNRTVLLGFASTTGVLDLNIVNTGILQP